MRLEIDSNVPSRVSKVVDLCGDAISSPDIEESLMEKRCGKCDGPLIKKDDGKYACSVCDPPVFSTRDENEIPSTSTKIVAPTSSGNMSSPAEPPKFNSNQALDSKSPKELSDNDGGLLPPTTSRPDNDPPVLSPPVSPPPHSQPPIPILAASLPPTSSPPLAPPVEDQPGVDTVGQATANESVLESTIAENELVLLPDGDGGFIETSERQTQINYRGAKIALSSMKREEKEATRGLKNFLVVTFCVACLLILIFVLSWLQGSSK